MRQTSANPIRAFVSWLGGWPRFILLIAVLIGLAGWYFWERAKELPVPPQARNTIQNLTTTSRDTTFVFNGTVDELRAFYQQQLPTRGWRYCGTRATPKCTNL